MHSGGKRADKISGVLRQFQTLGKRSARGRIEPLGVPAHQMEPAEDGGKNLTGIVVQVSGYPPALLVLGFDQAVGEPVEQLFSFKRH